MKKKNLGEKSGKEKMSNIFILRITNGTNKKHKSVFTLMWNLEEIYLNDIKNKSNNTEHKRCEMSVIKKLEKTFLIHLRKSNKYDAGDLPVFSLAIINVPWFQNQLL